MEDFIFDHPVLSKALILLGIFGTLLVLLQIVSMAPIVIVVIPLAILFGGLLYFLGVELWGLATSIYEDIIYWIQTR